MNIEKSNIEKYKLSKFANWGIVNNNIVVSALLTGESVCFSGKGVVLLKEYFEKKEISILDKEIFDKLIKYNILVKSNKNEDDIYDMKYYETVYSNKELHLIIYPTTGCNLRCKYCFENHKVATMQEETKERVLQFLENNVGKFQRIDIGWFGGEPLLNAQFVVDFMKRAKHICNNAKVPFMSHITTNGYNLNINVFNELVMSNVFYYEITLDGLEEIHNYLRPHVTKNDSFKCIMNNLNEIKKSKFKYFKIVIRVNISKELLIVLDEFCKLLLDNFGDDNRFVFLWHEIREWGGNDYKGLVTQGIPNLVENVIKKANEYGLKTFRYIPNIRDVLCTGCKKNAYIINTDGTISKCLLCTEAVDVSDSDVQEFNKLGYIDSKGQLIINEEKQARWIVRSKLENICRDCSVLPICLEAVCPHKRKFGNPAKCLAGKEAYIETLLGLRDELVQERI